MKKHIAMLFIHLLPGSDLYGRGRDEEVGTHRILRPQVRGKHRAGHQPRPAVLRHAHAALLR